MELVGGNLMVCILPSRSTYGIDLVVYGCVC